MERFESLINNLKNNYKNGAAKAQLLQLLEEMRQELSGNTLISDHTSAPVSVWLPSGYEPKSHVFTNNSISNQPASEIIEVADKSIHEDSSVPLPIESSVVEELIRNPEKPDQIPSRNPDILHTSLKPPSIIVEETIATPTIFFEEKEVLYSKNERESQLGLIEPNTSQAIVSMDENENKFDEEAAQVVEWSIDLPEDVVIREIEEQKEKLFIPPGFLGSEKSPVAAVTQTKELNEILANRVVAKPEIAKSQNKVLADALSSTKIHDLRKAIGINDRFRYIKSLFRGDETLFERSVKTINNFNILPEAEYWIQRELVIKLGWNEEDELVQQFYQLVNRRFL